MHIKRNFKYSVWNEQPQNRRGLMKVSRSWPSGSASIYWAVQETPVSKAMQGHVPGGLVICILNSDLSLFVKPIRRIRIFAYPYICVSTYPRIRVSTKSYCVVN